ncbi:DUF6895 family protein [Shewanella salipaludis]|uniref:DUF6895 domain-containing protein n=1 Tax=Shewanella salipaludis TaxID=2723052 RepID=A0A972JMM6_9GAMM|nr:hypothetical protein [Shewanella salipaludis]NMH66667.1 hypothetical protein [Shewanella salipaludis]
MTCVNHYQNFINDRIKGIDLWLDNHKEFFNPYNISDKDTTFLYRKSFCEYSLYLYVCDKHGIKDKSHELKTQFLDHLNDDRFLQLAKRHRELFLAFGLPIAIAKHLYGVTPSLSEYFTKELNSQHSRSLELVPFRMMDYVFAAQIFGDIEHIFPVKKLSKMSNYYRLPDPILADESQAYALTHNIFYLTGMQRKADFLALNVDFDHGVNKVLEALLLKYIAKKDLDLSLELLASLALIGHCKKWHIELVFSAITQSMENDDVIPGPVGRIGDDVKELHGDKFHHWAKNYHTMLVAAMCLRIINDQLSDITADESIFDLGTLNSLGHMQRLAAEYNLPLLLALFNSIENEGEIINSMGLGHIVNNTKNFIDSQRREDNYLGYFHDEKGKHKENQHKFESSVLESIKKIDRCINWNKLTFNEH